VADLATACYLKMHMFPSEFLGNANKSAPINRALVPKTHSSRAFKRQRIVSRGITQLHPMRQMRTQEDGTARFIQLAPRVEGAAKKWLGPQRILVLGNLFTEFQQ
jgi:hypothetical protein